MVNHQNTATISIYIDRNTSNKSFLDMHYYLRDTGIKNNYFFLSTIDSDLVGVNPRDPNLNQMMKIKILRECMNNYWYFIREVLRIPDQGGDAGGGIPYRLHRGNLALNFCLINNYNIFAEFPRQHGKTISVVCRLLWEFMFGTTNSEIMMINKKHQDSKDNLQRLKDIRAALPEYLRMTESYGVDGKKLKVKDSVETLSNPNNGNKIRTLPAARNRVAANSLGRGCTQPRQWYDEYGFIPFNGIIYLSATPAFNKASQNAKRNGAPYGILITTTPGDLTTEEGQEACATKDAATKFSEKWYDFPKYKIDELLSQNKDSTFVYIRYTYQQLGSTEEWFAETVRQMKKNWSAIRREVLLEWSSASDNSPFRKEDLNVVKSLIREPIDQETVGNYYQMNIYEKLNPHHPPIIGVDVSGGFKRDSSAITIIDSYTTRVVADFNCNYINTNDLAGIIYEIVTKYMRNAIVNVERNGGFGASVLAKLIKTSIKPNLYYEIKDKVIEERFDGINTVRKTQKTKIYGLDSTGKVREMLMEILRQRMELHKDKFISPIIYNELETLEVKKNGRIEHTSTGHDDQIFSYLMALYVWYEGKDIMERWGVEKHVLKTDQDLDEAVVQIEDKYADLELDVDAETNEMVQQQLNAVQDKSVLYHEWVERERQKDDMAMARLLSTRLGQKAYRDTFGSDAGMSYYNKLQSEAFMNDMLNNFYSADDDSSMVI